MVKQKILLLFVFVSSLSLLVSAKGEFDSESITQLMYQHGGDELPGMAVGIVQDGQIVFEHYMGYANLEHKVKVDANTRFNICSNAKQFTALCILKLIDQGKIKLEDDFRKYLPELYPHIEAQITVAHLLTHTSGIRDYCDLMALQGTSWWKQFIDNDDVVDLLKGQKDLNFAPGSDYIYSNSNYTLLTEIVAQVMGQKFNEFAKSVFVSLDMPHTYYLTHGMEVIPYKARPYGNWGTWREESAITAVHGDGALFTTLPDQLKWEQIVQLNDGSYLSPQVIGKSQSPISHDYGFGLMFGQLDGMDYIYHEGVTSAYSAMFIRFPARNTSIVVMTNNRSVPSRYLAWQIAEVVLDLDREAEKVVYPAGPERVEKWKQLSELCGIYRGEGEDASVIRITEKDGMLYREIYQRDPVKLIPEKGGLFAYETIEGLKMNFQNIGQSDQQFTLYLSSQKPSTYHRLSDLSMGGFDKTELNARFFNDETDTEIILQHVEGDTYTLTKNGRERVAKLVSKDFIRMMDTYKIKVVRDGNDQVIGLDVDRDRIVHVVFKKT